MPSTISGTVTTTVTLNVGAYTSSLRILSTAAIAPSAYSATGLVETVSGYALNEGLIIAGGGGVGVDLSAGSLTNNGTIAGGGGASGGNAIDLAGGLLINQGSITGGSATGAGGIGVDLTAGVLGNYGIISGGTGATGGAGVYLLTNTFTNYGTIEGGAGSTVGTGVVFKSGGTLRNFGVITGSDAVYFGTGTSRLIMAPGGSFTGAVVADAAYTNILELASAVTSGTLAGGIGTAYQNFSTIAVDTGAKWTLSGSSTLSASTSLLVSGTLTSTGMIEGSGVDVTGGSVINRGTIAGDTSVRILSGALTNYGTVAAYSGAVAVSVTTGNVYNVGVIFGGRGGATGGAAATIASGFIGNAGTMIGGAGSIGGIGAVFAGGGLLANAGLISGGAGSSGIADAVYFGTGASQLLLQPGASFGGAVVANASFSNLLELGTGSGSGTLTGGLGSEYQNFAGVIIDARASWTLAAASTIASGNSVTNHGRLAVRNSLLNDGLITGSSGAAQTYGNGAGTGGVALSLVAGGVLHNAGSIVGGDGGRGVLLTYHDSFNHPARGGAGGVGLYVSGSSFANYGVISGGGGGASDAADGPGDTGGTGGTGGAGIIVASGSFTNYATISGGNGGSILENPGYGGVGGDGAIIDAGSVVNHGLISAGAPGNGATFRSPGAIGAAIFTGVLTNYGTIRGGVGAFYPAGVLVATGTVNGTLAGATLFNHGTIDGGNALAFSGGGGPGVLVSAAGSGNVTNYGVIIGGSGGSGGSQGGPGIGGPLYGTVVNEGTIVGGAGRYAGDGVYIGIQRVENTAVGQTRLLINTGSIIGGSYAGSPGRFGGDGALLASGGTLIDSGFISGGIFSSGVADAVYFQRGDSRFILDPGANFNGAIVATVTYHTNTYTNLLEFATGSGIGTLAGLGSTVTGFGTIDFDSGASWFVGGNSAGIADGQTINGFTYGDTIELTNFVSTHHTFNASGLVLAAPGTAETLGIVGTFTSGDFAVTNDGTNSFISLGLACFATGTRIATVRGEIAVEELRIGDRVRTLTGDAPIIWIGRRTIDCTRHPDPRSVLPVRIAANAFGKDLPQCDLYLSPDHALFIDGALIPAKHLVNGDTIVQVPTDAITYFHIELPQHDVILAEGLPVESYLSVVATDSHREAFACAPLIVTGPTLEVARRRLIAA
jgi:fibronectin-binding autotransporter adhesin